MAGSYFTASGSESTAPWRRGLDPELILHLPCAFLPRDRPFPSPEGCAHSSLWTWCHGWVGWAPNFFQVNGGPRRLSQLETSSNLAQAIAGSAPSVGFRPGTVPHLRRALSSSSFTSLSAFLCRSSANSSPERCTHSSSWPGATGGWVGHQIFFRSYGGTAALKPVGNLFRPGASDRWSGT